MKATTRKKYALIVNQDAGKVPQYLKNLRTFAHTNKIRLNMVEGRDLDHAIRTALADEKVTRLIIGGGDGTISKAASLILRLRPNVELAVLALGTANYYAKSLGLGKSITQACKVALGNHIETRHLCRANRREFLIGVNVGTTSRMFSEVTDEEKQRFGKIAYFRGIFRILRRMTSTDLVIHVNGQKHYYASTELVILNQHIQERVKLTPEVSGTEPYVEIITYGLGRSKFSPLFATFMFALTAGKNQKYLKRIKTTKARITSSQRLPVAVDGDVLEKLPLEIELIKTPVQFLRV